MRHRIRYWFDNLLAHGTSASLVWLGVVTAAAVLISSVLLLVAGVTLSGSADDRWLEDVWQSLLRIIDLGTMANDVGWGRRLLALVITIFGLLVAGTLIGIIAAGVEDRIERMRRGRSVVIESDHIIVLGVSDRLPVLLQQLSLAGPRHRRQTIVVLANLDPAEIHAAARQAIDRRGPTRIVYRSGDPTDLADLALVRLETARAVIVLSDGRSDRTAVETLLAIQAELGGLDRLTVVVELLDDDTAERLRRAFGQSVHPIVTSEAVARTVAFALRQRGLSQVVDELLDFRGVDLHILDRRDLVDVTFAQLIRGFVNARPIGIQRADGDLGLSPAGDTRLRPGDRVVVIAGDPDAVEWSAPSTPVGATDRDRAPVRPAPVPERLVVIRWNALGAHVLGGWATCTSPASTVDVVVDRRSSDPDPVAVPDLSSIAVTVVPSDDVVADAVRRQPTTVVLLAPHGAQEDADVRTILDLAALHREIAATGGEVPRIVVELRDPEHRALLDAIGPDDLIISDAMGSQFIAQLASEPVRRDVLLELYAAQDVTIRLVPCEPLGLVGEHLVRDVVDRGVEHGLLVIGWRRFEAGTCSVTLDPDLRARIDLAAGDELVVIG